MTDAVFMKYAIIGLIAVIGVLIYFNFKIMAYYIKQIGRLETKYTNLAEMRDTTKIEDVMVTLERDIKAQNHRHEQEMMSAFHTLRSFVAKATGFKERRKTPSEEESFLFDEE